MPAARPDNIGKATQIARQQTHRLKRFYEWLGQATKSAGIATSSTVQDMSRARYSDIYSIILEISYNIFRDCMFVVEWVTFMQQLPLSLYVSMTILCAIHNMHVLYVHVKRVSYVHHLFHAHNLQNTLPKANIDPESRPSQKASSLPTNM